MATSLMALVFVRAAAQRARPDRFGGGDLVAAARVAFEPDGLDGEAMACCWEGVAEQSRGSGGDIDHCWWGTFRG